MKMMKRIRYAILQYWLGVRFWLRWKFNRLIWRWFCTMLWRTSPRLRQEFLDEERYAWNSGLAFVEFREWLGRRVWPDDGEGGK